MAAGSATGGQHRGVFEVDEDRAVVVLELAWADGGYHGFCADGGTWSARTLSSSEGSTPLRTHSRS